MKTILHWGARFGEQKWLHSRSLNIVVAAVAAFFAINYFFCPRFVMWRGLDLPDAWYFPELNRAVDALQQIRNPFAPIDHPSNDVLQWRLLFPLLAYCLAIPDFVYLILPHIGCVVTLGWVAKLMLDHTGSGWIAFLGAVMIGTTSWFFVSTGWLAYFDSWYILGLLLASFHRSHWLLVASCILVPWIVILGILQMVSSRESAQDLCVSWSKILGFAQHWERPCRYAFFAGGFLFV